MGQTRSWRKDVQNRGLHQFRELKIQPFSQLRPLWCVSENEDTGSEGLEKIAAFYIAESPNLRPPSPCYLKNTSSRIIKITA